MSLERFREPRFAALLDRARAHLEKHDGALSGSFSVPGTPEEHRRLNGFLGTDRRATRAGLQVDAARLDATLREGYRVGLSELLEHLGPKLRFRSEEEHRIRLLRERILAPARASTLNETPWFREWLTRIETKGDATRLVNAQDTHTLGRAVRVLETVAKRATDDPPLLLPHLAVHATGDTKALNGDKDTLPRLVLAALAERSGMAKPGNAEECRALWEDNDVVPDDLASRVLVLNLPAEGSGLGEWLTDAAARGIPFQVTLHQLVRMPIAVREPLVYACENPAVLRRAAEELGPRSAPLLCTEGWPSAAFHRVAEAVRAGGGRLRHHGDFDRAGLAITRRMVERHGASPWRMSAEDYLSHEAEESHPLNFAPDASPWDPDLAEVMRRRGHALFEETVADTLLTDLDTGHVNTHR